MRMLPLPGTSHVWTSKVRLQVLPASFCRVTVWVCALLTVKLVAVLNELVNVTVEVTDAENSATAGIVTWEVTQAVRTAK